MQRAKDFFGTQWDPIVCQRNPSHVAYSPLCRPDDGRVTAETCCLNDCVWLPVTRFLIKIVMFDGITQIYCCMKYSYISVQLVNVNTHMTTHH